MSKFAGLGLAVDEPKRMTLLHPVTRQPIRDGEGVAYIDLHSSDSQIARKHNREIQQRRLNMRGRGRLSTHEIEAEGIDLLAALTVSWRLLTLDGQPIDVPCNEDNARDLYSAPELAWVKEQADEFAADRANFS